jgi:hypothetical protein
MSDYEDEMDIDAPVADTAISFGGEKKGKRTAANLPVEAEDSLPWYVVELHAMEEILIHVKGRKVPAKLTRRC